MRKRWLEAVSDDSEGLNAKQVFENLERKYKTMAVFAALDAAKIPEEFMSDKDRDCQPPQSRPELDRLFEQDNSKDWKSQ
jgi:hypothetical protein